MSDLQDLILPIQGLKPGIHRYDFKLTPKFFARFEDSLIQSGFFDVQLILDRQLSTLDFHFSFSGKVNTSCDRCLAGIQLPILGENRVIVQFDEDEREEGEVLFIHPSTPEFDISPILAEAISLGMPIVKKYDCENDSPRPCDMETLKHLDEDNKTSEDANDPDNLWQELKKIK